MANLKFPFSASHMRLERGGWTQTLQDFVRWKAEGQLLPYKPPGPPLPLRV